MRLNLGSADNHKEGFVSVDRSFPPGLTHPHEVVDLASDNWRWGTSTIEQIIAHDIIEHLPDRINTMNEIWRILKPGGVVDIEVPDAAKGPGFYQDPTHVSAWTLNSFQYYDHSSYAVQRFANSYGIRARFEIVQLHRFECPDVVEAVWKVKAVLRAVK